MIRAVSRGIDTIEELKRAKREEAHQAATCEVEARPPSAGSLLPPNFVTNWDTVYPEVALSPSLITKFGFIVGAQGSGGRSAEVPQGNVSSIR